jgi:predicted chitinase
MTAFALKDRAAFYDYLRQTSCPVFPKKLSQQQVEGTEGILDAYEEVGDNKLENLAYCLATSYHETAQRMYPVREGLCSTDAGSIKAVTRLFDHGVIRTNYALPDPVTGKSYFGRGHVQLTWDYNYKKMGEKLGLDLYNNPDLALDPLASAKILIRGSLDGDFTGKKLDDYLPSDPINARRVINGTDKANLIAGYYDAFKSALQCA